MASRKDIRKALKLLRDDALQHRPTFDDLAIAYGWSIIRLGMEIILESNGK